ncbi:LYR motif-containing protein 4 isoform X2 [Notamacropus eugenii]|uniref:LYR motif-containing protein 4 isoform X2 n=1 Tax=Notamacropus eugenii TaxID=9315 RepID=UPI003B681F81
MAASSRAQVLDLYRVMLRESGKFTSYNYRTYAIRRIREAFRENKNVKDSAQIQMLVNKAKRNLEIIRRQLQDLIAKRGRKGGGRNTFLIPEHCCTLQVSKDLTNWKLGKNKLRSWNF